MIRDAAGREYPYEGHVEAALTTAAGEADLARAQWYDWLEDGHLEPTETLRFGFRITESNSIPAKQFELWAEKLEACAHAVGAALHRVDEAQRLLP